MFKPLYSLTSPALYIPTNIPRTIATANFLWLHFHNIKVVLDFIHADNDPTFKNVCFVPTKLNVIAQFHSGFQTNKNWISFKHNTSSD